jgi:hypothetical protein
MKQISLASVTIRGAGLDVHVARYSPSRQGGRRCYGVGGEMCTIGAAKQTDGGIPMAQVSDLSCSLAALEQDSR